jgi:hypothetical protein
VRVVTVPPAWRKIKWNGSLYSYTAPATVGRSRLSLRLYSFNDDASEIGIIFLSEHRKEMGTSIYNSSVESSITYGLHDFIFFRLMKMCDFYI